jgi:hypothetical protein
MAQSESGCSATRNAITCNRRAENFEVMMCVFLMNAPRRVAGQPHPDFFRNAAIGENC